MAERDRGTQRVSETKSIRERELGRLAGGSSYQAHTWQGQVMTSEVSRPMEAPEGRPAESPLTPTFLPFHLIKK